MQHLRILQVHQALLADPIKARRQFVDDDSLLIVHHFSRWHDAGIVSLVVSCARACFLVFSFHRVFVLTGRSGILSVFSRENLSTYVCASAALA